MANTKRSKTAGAQHRTRLPKLVIQLPLLASEPNTEPVLATSEPKQHVSAPEFTASVQDATTPVPVVIAPVQCQSLLQKGSCMSVLFVD